MSAARTDHQDTATGTGWSPGAARDLDVGFEEREPGTFRFLALPAVLGPADLHGASHGDIADALETPFFTPRRHGTAAGAARWLVGFDNNPAPAIVREGRGDDAVIGQVDDAGGSVVRRPLGSIKAQSRLNQGSWS